MGCWQGLGTFCITLTRSSPSPGQQSAAQPLPIACKLFPEMKRRPVRRPAGWRRSLGQLTPARASLTQLSTDTSLVMSLKHYLV